jgi:multiple sugar transport system ATP-binding protein
LGVRSENVVSADGDERNVISARLDVREPVGSDNYLHMDIEGDECWVRVPGDVRPEVDQHLDIAFEEENIHLFRQSDGINILAQRETELEAPADD